MHINGQLGQVKIKALKLIVSEENEIFFGRKEKIFK
jgi:hypothetical protein